MGVLRTINTLGNIRGLFVVSHQYRTSFVVYAVVGVVVAYALDGLTRDFDVIDVSRGSNLACQHN